MISPALAGLTHMPYLEPTHTFTHEGKELRVFHDEGRPWFVAKDVCALLGTSRNASQLAYAMPDSHRRKIRVRGRLPLNVINADGLIEVMRRSVKADDPETEANSFRRWVFRTVLPQLRQTTKMDELIVTGDGPVTRDEMNRMADRLIAMEARVFRLERRMNRR